MSVEPTGGALGARIGDLDLSRPLSDDQVADVRQALLDHCVLVFADQHLDDEDLVRFTSCFGTPVKHVRKQPDRDVEEVFIISNVKENGEPIGALGSEEIGFHSDLSYLPAPGTISLLYAVEVPAVGGDTHWCNCHAAYEALDDAVKQRLMGLRAIHRHYVESQNPPGVVAHPIVCTHPETGRKYLYVGPHLTKCIQGMEASASAELLGDLYRHVEQPRFVWSHHWRVDDLILWDNRPTMHRRDPFPDSERRVMKRTQIFNDEVPVA